MKTLAFKKHAPVVEIAKSDYIVAHWLEEITKLHAYYYQLGCTNLHQKVSQEKLSIEKIAYIGQCPTDPVISLLITMQVELERLRQDMTRQQLTITENYQKLAAHTRILKRLNQQAQTRLLLMTSTSQ